MQFLNKIYQPRNKKNIDTEKDLLDVKEPITNCQKHNAKAILEQVYETSKIRPSFTVK